MSISQTISTIRAHHQTCNCWRAMKWLLRVKRPDSLRWRPKARTTRMPAKASVAVLSMSCRCVRMSR